MTVSSKLQRPEMGKFHPEMWAFYEERLQATMNIFDFYPKAKEIMNEIYRTTDCTEIDLWGNKKGNCMGQLRGYIAARLKDEARLSNTQIGILLNKTPYEVAGLITRARS